jgi:lipopolysaccharide/colanic/teichoic acid biosynthesis glycosyltransferase
MYVSVPRYVRIGKNSRMSIKRAFDIAFSSLVLLGLSPLMLTIALAIRLTSKGSVLFRHRRVGIGGKEFYVYKFRTMQHGAEAMKHSFTPEQQAEFQQNYKLKSDPRVTPIGRVLRKTSLDELPQFMNVLEGDMSIVGPRPVTREELDKYGSSTDLVLSVNPGITGLWQVSGRSDTSYEERVRLDVRYAMQCGFFMDIRIILSTFRIVLARMGAY